MRYLACLILAALAASPVADARTPPRPQREGAFVYHFEDPQNWVVGGSVVGYGEITSEYGYFVPPYSLSLRAHAYTEGSAFDGFAHRNVDEIPPSRTFRVTAWVNGDEATSETGLQFRIDDRWGFLWSDVIEFRDRHTLVSDVYRRDIGPGWQRVQLGVILPLNFVPDVRRLSIYMLTPFGSPDPHWLVGQIEFSPAPQLDEAPLADLR